MTDNKTLIAITVIKQNYFVVLSCDNETLYINPKIASALTTGSGNYTLRQYNETSGKPLILGRMKDSAIHCAVAKTGLTCITKGDDVDRHFKIGVDIAELGKFVDVAIRSSDAMLSIQKHKSAIPTVTQIDITILK